jgi:hypothetical protein
LTPGNVLVMSRISRRVFAIAIRQAFYKYVVVFGNCRWGERSSPHLQW